MTTESNLYLLKQLTEKLNLRDSILRLLEAALITVKYGVILTDKHGKILWCNDYISNISGYSIDDLLGLYTNIFKSGKQDEEFYKGFWDTLLNGKIFKGILINKRKDGSLYNEYNIISPIFDDSGEIKYFFALKEDLTSEIEKDHGFLFNKEILNSIPFPIYCLNEAGHFVYVNREMCEKYGYSESEFISNITIFNINKSLNELDWKAKWNLIREKKNIELKVTHYTKDNKKLNTVIKANHLNIHDVSYDCSIIIFQEIAQ